jgi:hypothetical protein
MSHVKIRHILRLILIFLFSYFAYLFLWLLIKPYYGGGLVYVASHLVAKMRDMKVEGVSFGREESTVSFLVERYSYGGKIRLGFDLNIPVSRYTFNVPLTLAILTGLYFCFLESKRPFVEALFFLVVMHLVYLLSFENLHTYHILVHNGVISPRKWEQIWGEFWWVFSDNMLIRFEPFLINLYFLFRSSGGGGMRWPRRSKTSGPLYTGRKGRHS